MYYNCVTKYNTAPPRDDYIISSRGVAVKGRNFFIMAQQKSRYWVAVCYQENMRDDWREWIEDGLQLPMAYCEHTTDTDSRSEHRKDHVHIILAWPGPTTYKNAMEVFGLLSAPGKRCVNRCEAVINMRHMYDYLIHDTEACKKAGKEPYPPESRILGNSFDIGAFEQLSETEKREIIQEMVGFIRDNGLVNFLDLYEMCVIQDRAVDMIDILRGNSAFFQRLLDGMFQRRKDEGRDR